MNAVKSMWLMVLMMLDLSHPLAQFLRTAENKVSRKSQGLRHSEPTRRSAQSELLVEIWCTREARSGSGATICGQQAPRTDDNRCLGSLYAIICVK